MMFTKTAAAAAVLLLGRGSAASPVQTPCSVSDASGCPENQPDVVIATVGAKRSPGFADYFPNIKKIKFEESTTDAATATRAAILAITVGSSREPTPTSLLTVFRTTTPLSEPLASTTSSMDPTNNLETDTNEHINIQDRPVDSMYPGPQQENPFKTSKTAGHPASPSYNKTGGEHKPQKTIDLCEFLGNSILPVDVRDKLEKLKTAEKEEEAEEKQDKVDEDALRKQKLQKAKAAAIERLRKIKVIFSPARKTFRYAKNADPDIDTAVEEQHVDDPEPRKAHDATEKSNLAVFDLDRYEGLSTDTASPEWYKTTKEFDEEHDLAFGRADHEALPEEDDDQNELDDDDDDGDDDYVLSGVKLAEEMRLFPRYLYEPEDDEAGSAKRNNCGELGYLSFEQDG